MKKIKQNVTRFLKKHQMDYLDVDIDSNTDAFLKEMVNGLAGKKSTLDMIPTYIEVGADVPTNKRVIVVDAGGTNFRVATVYFDDQKKAIIENLHLYKMPGVQHEIGKDEFFKIMAGYLKDVAGAAQNIGFCFSYPVEVSPNKDGRLIRFAKEVKAKEVEGQLVGENINRALRLWASAATNISCCSTTPSLPSSRASAARTAPSAHTLASSSAQAPTPATLKKTATSKKRRISTF